MFIFDKSSKLSLIGVEGCLSDHIASLSSQSNESSTLAPARQRQMFICAKAKRQRQSE
ncbi:hypothetical protein [Lysinibacillus sp. TE18511]